MANHQSAIKNQQSSYVAYLRDSGGADQDLSTTEQAISVQRYCNDHDLTLLTIYIDDAMPGSSTVGRVQFNAMINALRARKYPNCTGVLIWSYSRFSRDVDDAQFYKSDLRRRGYTIISLTDPVPDGSIGRFIESAIDWKNSKFLEDLSTDVRRGLYHLVKEIGAVPGIPPRGFMPTPITLPDRRDGKPHIVHRWDPDPAWSDRVLAAFQMRAAGASYATLYNTTGIYRNKTSWNHFFANPIYKGELCYGDLVLPNYCPPIVPPELWQRVQSIEAANPRTKNPTMHPRAMTSAYTLSGILYCSCGSPMVGNKLNTTAKGWAKRYYACTRASRTHRAECSARFIPADLIEKYIVNYITDEILTVDALRELVDETLVDSDGQIKDLTTRQAAVTETLSENRRQVTNCTNAIIMAGHSPSLLARLKELETEQTALNLMLAEISAGIADLTSRPSDEDLQRVIKQMRPALQSGEPGLIRTIIRQLIVRITAERDGDQIHTMIELSRPTGQSHRGGSYRNRDISTHPPNPSQT